MSFIPVKETRRGLKLEYNHVSWPKQKCTWFCLGITTTWAEGFMGYCFWASGEENTNNKKASHKWNRKQEPAMETVAEWTRKKAFKSGTGRKWTLFSSFWIQGKRTLYILWLLTRIHQRYLTPSLFSLLNRLRSPKHWLVISIKREDISLQFGIATFKNIFLNVCNCNGTWLRREREEVLFVH